MKTGACYLRMSTDKQEHSIESQLRLIRDYAKRNNILLDERYIYSDEGISGRNAEKRPQFMQMIEDSSKHLFACVLIYDSSRFARNLEQSIVYKSLLKKNGIELISITEPTLDDDNSLLTDALLGAMNEMYSRKLSKNVKRGMEQKALRGEYLTCAAYGYDRAEKNKPLIINKEESKIILYVFEQYLNGGKSFYHIAKELNSMGTKTKRGNPIESRWVEYVLKNPAYKGYLKWSPDGKSYIIKKADHEAIIDEQIFEAVQQKISEHIKKRRYKEKPVDVCKHWLSGMLRCKSCGSTLSYANGWKGRKDRFRCGGYSHGRCSMSKTVTVNEIETTIIKNIHNVCVSGNKTYSVNIHVNNDNTFEIKSVAKDIERVSKSLERAKKAFLAGIDTMQEYKETKESLTRELETLEKRIQRLKDINPLIIKLKNELINVVEVLENNTHIKEKQNLVRSIIDNIVYDGSINSLEFYFFR